MSQHCKSAAAISIFIATMLFLCAPVPAYPGSSTDDAEGTTPTVAGLEECLETALQNNRRRPASRYAVEMAEAKHRQALAGYWPQIGFKGGFTRLDEGPNFQFPGSSMSIPGDSIPIKIPGFGGASRYCPRCSPTGRQVDGQGLFHGFRRSHLATVRRRHAQGLPRAVGGGWSI